MRNIAAPRGIHSRSTPIHKQHIVTRVTHSLARVFVPATVTLDAVQRDDKPARRLLRPPVPCAQPVTVGGDNVFDLW